MSQPDLQDPAVQAHALETMYKGAMARFAQIGVDADTGHRLFFAAAQKSAADAGVTEAVVDPRRADACATKIAHELGLTRKVAA